ncbi:MAG TPA: galactose oxidase-like domain-containing protein [Methylophilaceae bacterium]|nr:galactose oxidase-like domain-containing protein [Methylophilaceae bacterium]
MKKTGAVLFLLLALGSFSQKAAANPVTGLWQSGPNFPFFPVHLHLLPSGKIMIWPGDGGVSGDDPRLYDPVSGIITPLAKPGFDVFCSGHSFLPDGRLFVAGGHIKNSVGLPDATIYNPVTNTWSRQPRMNQGRWYPTTQMLPNGDVVVVSGDVDITTGSNPLPQVWQIATGTWRSLTNAQLKMPLYPYLFLAPNGRIFDAGPSVATRYLNTAGTGAWSFVANHVFTSRSRTYGAAVMYQPGKILNVGGGDPPTAVTEVIDLNAASPKWRNTQPMANARRQLNATLLPDGKVLATGGTKGAGFNNATTANLIFAAEMWNPATERWSTMASASFKRLYHSIAILLPDGRVLSTGGNGVTQTEFYSPPYLFAGPRPMLSSAPTAVGKGQSFFVGTPDATTVDTVSWIKIGSVTHTTNMNQGSFRTSSFTRQAGGITITAPNTTTVTAGHYMLFLLRGGVPSVAKIVRLDNNPGPLFPLPL